MQGPHQSEPEKLRRIYFSDVAASLFALLKSVSQTGVLVVSSELIRVIKRNFIAEFLKRIY
jgi:hypothetical protein